MANSTTDGDCRIIDRLQADAALDVLDPDERHLFDIHLASCRHCRRIRDSYSETAGLLGLAVGYSAPPAQLGDRIIAMARAERGSSLASYSPPERLTRMWSRRQVLAMVAVLVFGLIGLAWGALAQADAHYQRQVADRYFRYVQAHERAWSTLEQQAMVSLELRADQTGDASGRLYLNQDSDVAVLIVNRLPPLPEDRVYQVWLIRNGERTSGGWFRVDGDGFGWLKIDAPARLSEFQGVGITPEPPGGSAEPTGSRVLGGQL
ncbi:MAG TPA: anti-sigma factor [Chloroflexota bacterium]|nr:anti-sigma factor [Chloroflexota bacterium]